MSVLNIIVLHGILPKSIFYILYTHFKQFIMSKIIEEIISIMLISCLFSCSNKQNIHGLENAYYIDLNNSNVEKINADKVISSVKYIKLETKNDNFIGIITNIIFLDEKILIADKIISKSIYFFDYDGKFIKKIGGIGQGPNEYVDICHITLSNDNNEILVIDDSKSQILHYNLEGNYLQSSPLLYRAENIEYIDQNNIAYYNTPGIYKGYKENLKNTLLVSDLDCQVNYSLFANNQDSWFNFTTHADHLRKYNKSIYVTPNLSDTIYQVYPEGLQIRYILNGDKRPEINKTIVTQDYIDFTSNHRCFNGNFVKTNDYSIFGIYPHGSYPLFFTDKTKKAYQIKDKSAEPSLRFFNEGYIMTSYQDNILVTDVQANTILEDYQDNPTLFKQSPFLTKLVDSLYEEDNPILFFYTLNSEL